MLGVEIAFLKYHCCLCRGLFSFCEWRLQLSLCPDNLLLPSQLWPRSLLQWDTRACRNGLQHLMPLSLRMAFRSHISVPLVWHFTGFPGSPFRRKSQVVLQQPHCSPISWNSVESTISYSSLCIQIEFFVYRFFHTKDKVASDLGLYCTLCVV